MFIWMMVLGLILGDDVEGVMGVCMFRVWEVVLMRGYVG